MRKRRVVPAEFVPEKEKRFFWFAFARDKTERPIADLLAAGEPFVGPGEENRPGEPALHHAVDVPAEHLGLLVLGVANRVHPEFAENERAIFGKILEAQQITLEGVLIMQVNVETGEVAVLWQQEFRRR